MTGFRATIKDINGIIITVSDVYDIIDGGKYFLDDLIGELRHLEDGETIVIDRAPLHMCEQG